MTREHTMIDIETLGTEDAPALLTIGTILFNENGVTGAQEHSIRLRSNERLGLNIEPETLEWWLNRPDDARQELDKTGGIPIEEALTQLKGFVPERGPVWARPPRFDLRILEDAYNAADMDYPWSYSREACHRTLADILYPGLAAEVEREGVHHRAIDDARYQAREVIHIYNENGLWNDG